MPLKDVKRDGRLPRLGVIRLGWQEPNKSGHGSHPVAAGHFVLKDAADLIEFFGEAPTELPILFPFPAFDRNIEAYHRVWAGGICVCQGDGEIVNNALPFTCKEDQKGMHVYRAKGDRLVDSGVALSDFAWNGTQFNAGDIVPCPGGKHDAYPQCQSCNPSIVLKVMIRDPDAARFGYYQISTRSIGNYTHFRGAWEHITDDGRLDIPMNSVPFILRVTPRNTMYQDQSGMWTAKENFFLQLEVAPAVARAKQLASERQFMATLEGRAPEPAPRLAATVAPEDDMPEAEEAAPPPWAEDEPQDAEFNEDAPEPDPEPVETEPHKWTKAEANELIGWTRNDLVITDSQALEALGVAKISDYVGDPDAARAAIKQYLKDAA